MEDHVAWTWCQFPSRRFGNEVLEYQGAPSTVTDTASSAPNPLRQPRSNAEWDGGTKTGWEEGKSHEAAARRMTDADVPSAHNCGMRPTWEGEGVQLQTELVLRSRSVLRAGTYRTNTDAWPGAA